MVLEEDGEYPAYNKIRGKANWIVRILSRNCLLKHIIEGNIEGERKLRENKEEDISGYWMTLRK